MAIEKVNVFDADGKIVYPKTSIDAVIDAETKKPLREFLNHIDSTLETSSEDLTDIKANLSDINSELEDARKGSDGAEYTSIGAAIRAASASAEDFVTRDEFDVANDNIERNINNNSQEITRVNQTLAETDTIILQQINNMGQSVDANANELDNAKLGANGIRYNSLGEAIRTQVTNIKATMEEDINTKVDSVVDEKMETLIDENFEEIGRNLIEELFQPKNN